MFLQECSNDSEAVGMHYLGDVVLRSAVGCWFFVTLVGQWLFMYYIVALYGASTVTGHFEGWARKPTLFKGYIPGDTVGNLAFASHVLFAAVVAFGGTLQLIPHIRERAIGVHRWIGRTFLVAAVVIGGGGLYMVWVRHARFDAVHSFSISLNAVLILVFVAVAWRAARVGDVESHRRWALRTFMVANGAGLFIRVIYAGWSVFTVGAGTTKQMDGPMNYFFAFASYLLPLAVLELYLRARASTSTLARFATAIVVVALTAYMTVGTFAAAMARRGLVG
jgi:uncharacterized membrane protein